MTDKRITKRDNFELLTTVVEKAHAAGLVTDAGKNQLDGFINHEVELLDKRAAAKGGDTKRKAAQLVVKQEIQRILADTDEPMKATAIHIAGAGTSVQQVTALLRQLVEDGTVVRTEEKKVATFSLA